MEFTVASYNVLADGYVDRAFYPRTPAGCLDPEQRRPRVAAHVARLGADVIGLQEVERATHDAIDATLIGYRSAYASKQRRREGCATFFSRERVRVVDERRVTYVDDSGHVALLLALDVAGVRIAVANTHLKWDGRGIKALTQARHLLREMPAFDPGPWIVLGDFNVDPSSDVLAAFHEAGLHDAHDPRIATCNANGRAKKIDYILHDARLVARAHRTPVVADDTPLPSPDEPSDHVPLVASFVLGR